MNNILREIVANKRREIDALESLAGNRLTELEPRLFMHRPVSMSRAIKESGSGIIAELSAARRQKARYTRSLSSVT